MSDNTSTNSNTNAHELNESEKSLFARIIDSDMYFSFRQSKIVMGAAFVTLSYFLLALFAPLIAPQNPFDLAGLDLMDGLTPPAWEEEGLAKFPLGTDDQGRDLLSAIMYGSRLSLAVGFASVAFCRNIGHRFGLDFRLCGRIC